MRRNRGILIAGILLALARPDQLGAQTDASKILEMAKKEGELEFYGGFSVADFAQFVRRFNSKYPFIKVNHMRAGAEKLMTRIITEREAGKYTADVIQIRGFPAQVLIEKKVFAKYLSPESKAYAKGFTDPQNRWTTLYVQTSVIAFNTRAVKAGEIKTWEDLLNPKWKGQMVIDREETEWFANMLKVMGKEKGLRYMQDLADQNPNFREGHTLMAQLVAAGEHKIGISLYAPRIEDLKAKGAPIEWVQTNPVIGFLYLVGIAEKAPHPNTARLFLDFALSKEGQTEISRAHFISMRHDVKADPPGLVEGVHILPSDLDLARDYDQYYKDFQRIFVKGSH